MEVTLTKDNFEAEVTGSDMPVLVDFWADWCGPCKMLAPVLTEVADENPGVKVAKLNIDDEPELAQKFGVMSIPTLILFKEGKEVAQMVGVQPKETIENMITG